MIAYVKGALTYKSPTQVIIESAGIGYEINISLNTYEKIQSLEECRLHTHFHVKEDSQTLYGFWEQLEKRMFLHLISVSGVGPNTARMVLSSMQAVELQQTIVNGDAKSLQRIKGIGPKSAQRLVLELKDKVAREGLATMKDSQGHTNSMDDALSALSALGISRPMAQKALNKAAQQSGVESVEQLVKTALKLL